ncbi:hypothetical protein D3C83_117200 [compost metagenome]
MKVAGSASSQAQPSGNTAALNRIRPNSSSRKIKPARRTRRIASPTPRLIRRLVSERRALVPTWRMRKSSVSTRTC